MDVAVIGAGSIGRRHAGGLAQAREALGVGAIRVYDPDVTRAREAAQLDSGITASASAVEALAGASAVFVCAPTSLHTQVMEQVHAAGAYHVFMEKPLASSLAGCRLMLERQRKMGKVFFVGYPLRWHPMLQRLKDLIAEGFVGRPIYVRAESGFFLPYWHPHEDYRHFYMSWRWGGGGALLDTSHEIDYLCWLFGPVAETQGSVETASDLEITSDDLVLATLRFKSGVRGQVHLDLLQFDEARHCKVIGTEGVITADLTTRQLRRWRKDAKAWETEAFELPGDGLYGIEYREFFAACRGETTNAPAIDEAALHTMEVIEGIRRSSSTGGVVRLPLWDYE